MSFFFQSHDFKLGEELSPFSLGNALKLPASHWFKEQLNTSNKLSWMTSDRACVVTRIYPRKVGSKLG